MSQNGVCPGVQAYRDLMRGDSVPDRGTLLTHLNACRRCQEIVRMLDDVLSRSLKPEGENRRRAKEIVDRALGRTGATVAAGAYGTPATSTGVASAVPTSSEMGWLGNYRLLGILGRGGMGLVFEAEDAGLGRRLAVKVMRPEFAADPSHRERFLREARAMASVESDHVCPVFQVGEANGVPFIAMPLLKGESLDVRLQRDSRLPLEEALRIGREIALGLQAAHEMGLIHRDVKPANVWLEAPGGRVKLLDFGLARGGDSNLTRVGDVMGTPTYQPLEQARGQRVDLRADLFSLGVILYEMLTGTRPYSGNDPASLLVSLTLGSPAPPSLHRPEIPAELDGLILALLAKMPQDRPDRAEVVADRLAQLLDSAADQPQQRPRWSRLVLVVLIAAIVLGGLGAAVAYVVRTRTSGNEGPDPAVNTPKEENPPRETPKDRVSPETDPRAEAEKLYREGLEAWIGKNGSIDEKRAWERFEQAAQKGHVVAAARLGWMTWAGRGGDKDEPEGAKKIQAVLAALRQRAEPEQGDADAQAILALLLRDGAGVGRDEKEAVRLLRAASLSKHADAAYELGWAYEKGRGLDSNEAAARDFYQRAEGSGHRRASDALARLDAYRKAMKEGRDAAALRKWAEAAAAYAAALKHKPDDPAAKAGLEAAQDELGRIAGEALKAKEEEAAFRRAMQKAQAAMKLRKYGEARQAFRDALAIRPSDPQARQGLDQAAALLTKQELDARNQETEKLFREGMDAWLGLTDRIDQKLALTRFEQAAAREHVVAAGWAGRLTYLGRGTKKDEPTGLKLVQNALPGIRKLAAGGDAEAQVLLGALLAVGMVVDKDEKEAFVLYKKSAEKGNVAAMTNLGVTYAHGLGVTKDEEKAVEWYRLAAAKGSATALTNLGVAYSEGKGVEKKDDKKAVECYRKGADKGHGYAMIYLGGAYAEGQGVGKDRKEADRWFRKAAELHQSDVTFRLAELYFAGDWMDKDEEKAAELYLEAAEQGHDAAMNNLGRMYEYGQGVKEDRATAVEWYRKSAAAGSVVAMKNLGVMYQVGRGVRKDEKQAVAWYEKAAAKGEADAMFYLGLCYEQGTGVTANKTKAVEWYRKAADKGHERAKQKVKELSNGKE